jgi:hypothetical protein
MKATETYLILCQMDAGEITLQEAHELILRLSDVMGSLSRFEKFFRNEHPTMFYQGDKMNKNEILKLVEEFFKTVKDNDEGMWKDGIDGNTMGIGL